MYRKKPKMFTIEQLEEVTNLTDKELSEWLAINFMGWGDCEGVWYCDGINTKYHRKALYDDDGDVIWNPAQDLIQARLAQETILKIDSLIQLQYMFNLDTLLKIEDYDSYLDKRWKFFLISARQICEAIYLTFRNLKNHDLIK